MREARFRSLCVAATVVVSTLLLLVLLVGVRILSGGAGSYGRLVTVASRTAPFVTNLPMRMRGDLAKIGGTDRVSPLIVMAVTIGTDRVPTALQGVDFKPYLAMNPNIRVDGAGHEEGAAPARGEAVVGRAFATSHGLRVGDAMVVRIVKSFIPVRTDRLDLRVGGIYRQTGDDGGGERQILVDYRMLNESLSATPGLASAFLIEAAPGSDPSSLSRRLDTAMATTATPTVSGDQSVVLTTLVGRFADVGRVARVIGVLSSLVFFAVLVGAANELLLRDRRDHQILQALGFPRWMVLSLSLLKWSMAAVGGLLLASLQIGSAILLLGGFASLPKEVIMPRWSEAVLAIGGALGIAALAFAVATLVTGLLGGGRLERL